MLNEPRLYIDLDLFKADDANPLPKVPDAGGDASAAPAGGGRKPNPYKGWTVYRGNRADPSDLGYQQINGRWIRPPGGGRKKAAKVEQEGQQGQGQAPGEEGQQGGAEGQELSHKEQSQAQVASQQPSKTLVSSGDKPQGEVSSTAAKIEAAKQGDSGESEVFDQGAADARAQKKKEAASGVQDFGSQVASDRQSAEDARAAAIAKFKKEKGVTKVPSQQEQAQAREAAAAARAEAAPEERVVRRKKGEDTAGEGIDTNAARQKVAESNTATVGAAKEFKEQLDEKLETGNTPIGGSLDFDDEDMSPEEKAAMKDAMGDMEKENFGGVNDPDPAADVSDEEAEAADKEVEEMLSGKKPAKSKREQRQEELAARRAKGVETQSLGQAQAEKTVKDAKAEGKTAEEIQGKPAKKTKKAAAKKTKKAAGTKKPKRRVVTAKANKDRTPAPKKSTAKTQAAASETADAEKKAKRSAAAKKGAATRAANKKAKKGAAAKKTTKKAGAAKKAPKKSQPVDVDSAEMQERIKAAAAGSVETSAPSKPAKKTKTSSAKKTTKKTQAAKKAAAKAPAKKTTKAASKKAGTKKTSSKKKTTKKKAPKTGSAIVLRETSAVESAASDPKTRAAAKKIGEAISAGVPEGKKKEAVRRASKARSAGPSDEAVVTPAPGSKKPKGTVSDATAAVGRDYHNASVRQLRDNLKSHLQGNKKLKGADRDRIQQIHDALDTHGTIEGAPTKEHKELLRIAKQASGEHGKARHSTAPKKAAKKATPAKKTATKASKKATLDRMRAASTKGQSDAKASRDQALSDDPNRRKMAGEPPPVTDKMRRDQARREDKTKRAAENKKAREEAKKQKEAEAKAAEEKLRDTTPDSAEGMISHHTFRNESKTLADNIRHHMENSEMDDSRRQQLSHALTILDSHDKLKGIPTKDMKAAQSGAKRLAAEHGKAPKAPKAGKEPKEPKEKQKRPIPYRKMMGGAYRAGKAAGQAASTPEAAGAAATGPMETAGRAAGATGHQLLHNRKVDKDNKQAKADYDASVKKNEKPTDATPKGKKAPPATPAPSKRAKEVAKPPTNPKYKKRAPKTPEASVVARKIAQRSSNSMSKSLYIDIEKGASLPNAGITTPSPEKAKKQMDNSYQKRPGGVASAENIEHDGEEEKDKKKEEVVEKSFTVRATDFLKSINTEVREEIRLHIPSSLEAEFMVDVLGYEVSRVRKGLCVIQGSDRHRFNEWAADRLSKSIGDLNKRLS